MTKTNLVMLSALLATSACVSTGKSGIASAPVTTVPSSAASVSEGAGVSFGPIQNAAIPEKKCGMVLWTLEGERPTAVFRFVSGEQGEMVISGQPVAFTRMDYSGAAGFGVYEKQVFRSDAGQEVEIDTRFGLNFDGGAYLERGLIKLKDQNGWSIVAPTAGVAGCR